MARPPKILKTKFGELCAEDIGEYRTYEDFDEDSFNGKFYIYDSKGNFLDYYEPQTILECADRADMTPSEWWHKRLEDICKCETIEDLLDELGIYSYGGPFNLKDEVCKERLIEAITESDAYSNEDVENMMARSLEDILDDYFDVINYIGDYIILNWE